MRIVGSLILALAGTVVGLFGALMLALAGVHWDSGLVVAQLSDSDDSERAIGIAMGVAGLAGWAALSFIAAYAGLGGQRPSRVRRIAVWTTLGLGVAILASAIIFVLFFNIRH